jgi:hypothetical protein
MGQTFGEMAGLPAALNCEFLNTPAKGNPMKAEKLQPALTGRIDALQIALVTLIQLSNPPRFEGALAANAEAWRSGLIASSIQEEYLDQFDSQLVGLLNLVKG